MTSATFFACALSGVERSWTSCPARSRFSDALNVAKRTTRSRGDAQPISASAASQTRGVSERRMRYRAFHVARVFNPCPETRRHGLKTRATKECTMRLLTGPLVSILITTSTFAAIQTKPVEYKAGDATLKGVLAWDDAVQGKRPGVIV